MINITVLDGKQIISDESNNNEEEIVYTTPTWSNQSTTSDKPLQLWLITPEGEIFTGINEITKSGRSCVPISTIRNGKYSGITYELYSLEFDDIFVSVGGSWLDMFSIDECYNKFVELVGIECSRDSFELAMKKYRPEEFNILASIGDNIQFMAEAMEMETYTPIRVGFKVPYEPTYNNDGSINSELPVDTYPEANITINDQEYHLTVRVDEEYGDYYVDGLPDEAVLVELKKLGAEFGYDTFEGIIIY